VFGVLGYVVYGGNPRIKRVEPQMNIVWFLMIAVGLGSVYFHGTLSVAGQISDELPIVMLCTALGLMSRAGRMTDRDAVINGHVLGRLGAVLCTLCLFFPVLSHVLTVAFMPVNAGVIGYDYYHSPADKPVFKKLFWTTQSLFLLAFVCWILDRVACEEITGFGLEHFGFYPQLPLARVYWAHVLVDCRHVPGHAGLEGARHRHGAEEGNVLCGGCAGASGLITAL
jgi:hypothetical protein